jgi:hypothetical protein
VKYLIDQKPSPEELEHAGVKGMHWGVRKNPEKAAQKAKLKELDKKSRARDNAVRDKEIDAARERFANTSRDRYLKAKAQYKIDKTTIGKREARKKLDAVLAQNQKDFDTANMAKSGHETTVAVLSTVGTIGAALIINALAGGMQNRRL